MGYLSVKSNIARHARSIRRWRAHQLLPTPSAIADISNARTTKRYSAPRSLAISSTIFRVLSERSIFGAVQVHS